MSDVRDVLIVDDDDNMRATLAEILAEDGFDVGVAASGEEAVEVCRHQTFRLVLMDVRMPGMDGVEACRRIRAHCKRSQIVIMSAQAEAEMERLALRAGVLGFLRKPLDVEAVIKLIAEATSRLIMHVGAIDSGAQKLQQSLSEARLRSTFVGPMDEALALLEQIHYDAIVLDLDEIDDAENAIANIRDYHPTIPLLAATTENRNAETSASESSSESTYAVIEKPLSAETLLGLLDRIKRERINSPR